MPTRIHPGPWAAVLHWYGPFQGRHEDGKGHLVPPPHPLTLSSSLCSPDIDECSEGSHACRYNQLCQNTAGTYRCACPPGYRSLGTGWPCLGMSWGLRGRVLGYRVQCQVTPYSAPASVSLPSCNCSSLLHQT